MAAKGNAHKRYKVHGDGMETLPRGLDELGMPANRRFHALMIVREVTDANNVVDFRW